MGIRNNDRVLLLGQADVQLTTPHGDQKPAPIYAPESDVPDQASLPLMGIRNTIGDTFTVAGFFRSLPLMGIRNIDASEKLRHKAHHSLPLMGIGEMSRPLLNLVG